MGSPGYLVPPDTTSPTAPPVLPDTNAAPGFWGTLGQVLSNIKIGMGPKSMLASGAVGGMSVNDLLAPVRQVQQRTQLYNIYLGLHGAAGMDTTPFRNIKFGPLGPPPELLKTMGDTYKETLQYGNRRPMGAVVAEQMFPQGTQPYNPHYQLATDVPQEGLPAEQGALPIPVVGRESGRAPTPGMYGTTPPLTVPVPLTPQQAFARRLAASSSPRDFARDVPTLVRHFPELWQGNVGGADPEKTRILDEAVKAYSDASPETMALFRNYPNWMFHGEYLPHTLQQMQQAFQADRQNQNQAQYHEDMNTRAQATDNRIRDLASNRATALAAQWRQRAEEFTAKGQAKEAAAAQREHDWLVVKQTQFSAQAGSQTARAQQVTVGIQPDAFGKPTVYLRVPSQVYAQQLAQGQEWINRWPTDQRGQMAEAFYAAQALPLAQGIGQQLYKMYNPGSLATASMPRGQQRLTALPQDKRPPILTEPPPTTGGGEALADEVTKSQDRLNAVQGRAAPPTLPGAPLPSTTPSNALPVTKAPLTKEEVTLAAQTAYRQVNPKDAAGRAQWLAATKSILLSHGHSAEDVNKALE